MQELTTEQKISNFIYDYPEVVVRILNNYGYNINVDTATLPEINELTFKAIIVDNNIDFATALDNEIANGDYSNFVFLIVGAVISLASALIGSSSAEKARQAQINIALANLSANEKLTMEKIRAESETARTQILANTLESYRATLVKESTKRLSDTWIYITGLGLGIGIIYGVYLLAD